MGQIFRPIYLCSKYIFVRSHQFYLCQIASIQVFDDMNFLKCSSDFGKREIDVILGAFL